MEGLNYVIEEKQVPYIVTAEEKTKAIEVIKGIFLTRCASIMKQMISSEERERKYRPTREIKEKFPRTAIIKMNPDKAIINHMEMPSDILDDISPEPLLVWKYEEEQLRIMPKGNAGTQFKKGEGKYHNMALFDFQTDFCKGIVYFSYSFGPLYGCGTILDILSDGENIYLGNERTHWIS